MITDGLILGPGPEGRCDSFRLGGAVVDHDALGGVWRLWYYCRDRELHGRAPPTLGTGRIALATSPDGVAWSRVDGPLAKGAVLEPSGEAGAFDTLHVGLTDVTRGAGEWMMWYFGGDDRPRETTSALGTVVGLGLRPGLATSPDGLNWRRVRGEATGGALIDYRADQGYVAWPNVFHDGRRWVMQVTTPDLALDRYGTEVAVSDDGRRWRGQGGLRWADGERPWDRHGLVTRQVLANPLPVGGRFLMIYTGMGEGHARSIGAAHSDDGEAWTHLYDHPVFGVGAAGAWDSLGVAATRLVCAAGRLHLYYYGFQSLGDDGGMRGIGLAISDTLDLAGLTRVRSPLG